MASISVVVLEASRLSTVAGSLLVWGLFIVSVMVLVAFLTMFANVCVDSREALTAAWVLALLMIWEYVCS